MPSRIARVAAERAASRRSTVVARSSSHGRRGAGMPVARCRGDEGARRCASGRSARGRRRARRPRRPARPPTRCVGAEAQLGDVARRPRGASSLRPAARVRGLERHQPPGSGLGDAAAGDASGRSVPATGSSTTSFESDSSAMRSATRRFVLARRLSLMTPAGRCVAMIRWMPSERPRWAMSTTPSTNSGTSPASAANSSITSTSAGGRLGVAAASRARAGPWPSCG